MVKKKINRGEIAAIKSRANDFFFQLTKHVDMDASEFLAYCYVKAVSEWLQTDAEFDAGRGYDGATDE